MDNLISTHHFIVMSVFLSLVLIGNIPIGFYRKRFPKFSRPWARCIYIPILANIVLRRFFGLGYGVIPFTILFVIAGQFIGSRVKRGDLDSNSKIPPISN
ncbi:MAG: hypothetical protein HZB54_06060 [Deltaproteobacteria bacterium]|nr:hypothetical protein [Deltaproteobacteria bacterium]